MINKSYLAAPYRNYLSATAKAMLKHQLLGKDESHLDYGCGRGGDFQRLTELGFQSNGYDPYYFPDEKLAADVVSMGYVLNVIESLQERREALINAWKLTKKRLIVSANVRGCGIDQGKITNLGTYSKSYNYVELKGFIESTLGYEAIKIDKDKFLINRDGQQFTPLHYTKILEEIRAIASQGWIPPMDAIIKGYCNDFKPRPGKDDIDSGEFPGRVRHYRILAKSKSLPGKNGLVRCLHISNGIGSDKMQWAIQAMERRNKIAEMKFHCIEQTFLDEFLGVRNFDFLKSTIKIYR